MTPTLVTARLTLRPTIDVDAEALFPMLRDADTMRWWSRAPISSIEDVREYLAPSPSSWRRWIVTWAVEDRALGWVAAGERRKGVSEIGYILARDVQGQGVAREAVSAVLDRLFAEGTRRVFADVDTDNVASNGLLERLGFQREGVLRAEWHTHIGVRDSVIWGLLADEWRVSS